MGKTVLILGNGFDLAHGLPTKYSDFLNFCEIVLSNSILKLSSSDWLCKYITDESVRSEFIIKYYERENDFRSLLYDNTWYKFLRLQSLELSIKGENWIDFESAISFIIEKMDKHIKNITDNWYSVDIINSPSVDFSIKFEDFKKIIDSILTCNPGTVKNVRKKLYDDLKNIIKALEIYLYEFVEKYIKPYKFDLFNYISPDHIINFNYTHTYQNVYRDCNDVFFIHGELNHEPNNMVLGIDEYWSEEERDSHTNFTIFKKFAQRIQKRTGIESYKWFDEIKSDYSKNNEVSEIFIFGHSLDITDKDILYDYLASEATSVTIYCRDEETEGEYIANVIKIIGEKRLLEKVNQYPPKLRFVIQQDMIPITIEEKEVSTSGAAK